MTTQKILKEIKEIRQEKNIKTSKLEGLQMKLRELQGLKFELYKEKKSLKEWKDTDNEVYNLEKEIKKLDNILGILSNNYKNLYLQENKELLISVFKKYENKKIGDKTKEKLYQELKDNNLNLWFNRKDITFNTELGRIQAYCINDILTNDNKLNIETLETLTKWNDSIIDSPKEYLENKEKEFNRIVSKIKELETEIDNYNKDINEDVLKRIERQYKNHFFN